MLLLIILQITQIILGGETLTVEIADTPDLRQQGLKKRESLEENHGMLFIFERPRQLFFWMKDTRIPLSIAFFDEEKKLLRICDMYPEPNDPPTAFYASQNKALYALELSLGWYERHHIRIGEKFSFLDCEKQLDSRQN